MAWSSGLNRGKEWVDGTSIVLIGAWSSRAPEIVELYCERISEGEVSFTESVRVDVDNKQRKKGVNNIKVMIRYPSFLMICTVVC